jgi:hypothetical protein
MQKTSPDAPNSSMVACNYLHLNRSVAKTQLGKIMQTPKKPRKKNYGSFSRSLEVPAEERRQNLSFPPQAFPFSNRNSIGPLQSFLLINPNIRYVTFFH